MADQDKRDNQMLREENELLRMENMHLLNQHRKITSKMQEQAAKDGVECSGHCESCEGMACLGV